MTDLSNNSIEPCAAADVWQPLVSAYMDGELSLEDVGLVDSHLEACPGCRETLNQFAIVESSLLAQPSVSLREGVHANGDDQGESCERLEAVQLAVGKVDYAPDDLAKIDLAKIDRSLKPVEGSRGIGSRLLRWIPLAAAASVIGGIGFLAMVPTSSVTAEEFADPVTEIELIHQQEERDQALMMRLLGLELRALQHELSVLNTAGDDKREIAATIEQLMEQVNGLQQPTN